MWLGFQGRRKVREKKGRRRRRRVGFRALGFVGQRKEEEEEKRGYCVWHGGKKKKKKKTKKKKEKRGETHLREKEKSLRELVRMRGLP